MFGDRMDVRTNIEDRIMYASFFFVDIVGLSDPVASTNTQIRKIEALNKCILECQIYQSTPKDQILVLPAGDGMAVGFLNGLDKPVRLAIELHQNLRKHNVENDVENEVAVRIGCNDGHVFVVNDIYGNKNIWGPGIIIARRIMDLADAWHILLSANTAENLVGLSDYYRNIIHPVHDFQIKHNQNILIYSVYGKGFGNPSRPRKAITTETKALDRARTMQKNLTLEKLELNLSVADSKEHLVVCKKTYTVTNTGKEPVFFLHETIRGVPSPISQIDLRVFDEDKRPLGIQEIVVDTQETKEIVAKLKTPIAGGERDRSYSVEYKIEEPSRSHSIGMLPSARNIEITFDYPSEEWSEINPRLFLVRGRLEKIVEPYSTWRSHNCLYIRWKSVGDSTFQENDRARLEW